MKLDLDAIERIANAATPGDSSGYGVMRSVGDLGKEEHPLGPRFEVPYRRQFTGIDLEAAVEEAGL